MEKFDQVETKKSQLLYLDGSENFKKDLIQLCFESWEVDETNGLQRSGKEINSEVLIPFSLFVDKTDRHGGAVDNLKPKTDLDSLAKELQDRKRVGIVGGDDVPRSKYGNVSACVLQRFSGVFDDNAAGWKFNVDCSRTWDIRGNKRNQKKKLKTFSFYKHTVKHDKPTDQRPCNGSSDRSATCSLDDLRKYKKWLDSVERIKKHGSGEGGGDPASACACSFDDEANELERRVRKLIETLKEKERSSFGRDGAANGERRTATNRSSSGSPSNRFRHFFRNAFRGGNVHTDELDIQLLDDYAEYIEKKLHTWWTLLCCLENVRRTEAGNAGETKTPAVAGKTERPAATVRKSLSDTDLAWTAGLRRWDGPSTPPSRLRACRQQDVDRSGGGERLWKERHERFRTAVARLEYVGSSFREPCRLAGLKTLCEVEVLVGAGRPAEAVNLFVSALPLCKSPELMIRKAEAAYDWEFFCHLSMWRHSYKDETVRI